MKLCLALTLCALAAGRTITYSGNDAKINGQMIWDHGEVADKFCAEKTGYPVSKMASWDRCNHCAPGCRVCSGIGAGAKSCTGTIGTCWSFRSITCSLPAETDTAGYSTANPEMCSHVTCDIIKAHNCAYHEGTGRAGGYSAGAQNTLGMGSKQGNDGCRGTHGYGGTVSYDECHGKYQWRGALSSTCSFCETCTGSSIHHSMRIHHHNGETKCSQYKDVSCNGKGCVKKSQWERTVGAICGIGLVTGKAGCECRPQCGSGYEYIDGACRSKYAQHSDNTACTCSNGTAKTSGCYSHADSCATCNSGYFRHRVSTDTSTGWECVKMTSHGIRHRHNNVEHKCAGDNKYQTAGGSCLTCAVGSYTHGGTNGERTQCSTCPAGSACDGSSTVTRCSAGQYAAAGSRSCNNCSGRWFSAAGAAQCQSCASNKFVPSGNTRCVACPAGYGCNGASKTQCSAGTAGINGVCVACNQGSQYTSSDGARACQTCPAGSYLTGRTQCTKCPAGASCDGKTETPCSAGTYAKVAGMAQCSTCPTGFHVTDSRKACTKCPPGHQCDGTNKVVCPQGYRSENGACHICPAGTFGDRTNCHRCATGHSAQQGAASCGKCAANDYITNGQCVTCPAGHRCDGDKKYPCHGGTFAAAGATSCSNCAAGHVAGTAAAACTACAAGTIRHGNTCVSCPAGYSCDGTNQIKCLGGYYAAGGASACSPCGADNKYSGAGAAACKTCGEGYFTHGGQAGTRTHCDGCAFNVNRASGTLTWLGWNEDGRKHAHCTGDCDSNNDCASGSTCEHNLDEAQLQAMGCGGTKYSSSAADYCVAGTPPVAASDVGYTCDGTSVKTKCDESKSYRHQVGTCVPTNGDDRHPYSKRFTHCLAKKTETACSPNDPEASPFTGDVNTGCSWLQRDVHVTLYSNPRCVPKVRSTDIMSGKSGCPTCAVNGKAYVETTADAMWTDPGATCVDASGAPLSYVASAIPAGANGHKVGTHVLTYIAVDASGKYSFACNNAHTWTRTVVVSAGSGNNMVTTMAVGEE